MLVGVQVGQQGKKKSLARIRPSSATVILQSEWDKKKREANGISLHARRILPLHTLHALTKIAANPWPAGEAARQPKPLPHRTVVHLFCH